MAYWCAMLEEWQEMQQQFIDNLPMKLPDVGFKTIQQNPWEILHLNSFMTWGQSAVKQSMDLQSHWIDHWLEQMHDEAAAPTSGKAEMISRIQESMTNWSENQTDLWTYWFKMVEETTDSFEDTKHLADNISLWKSTVTESLTSQTDRLEKWTKEIKIDELTTEELSNVSDKIQETMNGCLELQWELWSQWFNFLDLSSQPVDAASSSIAKQETKKQTALENTVKDNLEQIKGIGPALAEKLYSQGINTFDQIAELTEKEIDKLEETIIKFPGRIRRENWVVQATSLLDGA